jgi:hypothetical protein
MPDAIAKPTSIARHNAQAPCIGFEKCIGESIAVTIRPDIRRKEEKVRPVHRCDYVCMCARTVESHEVLQVKLLHALP